MFQDHGGIWDASNIRLSRHRPFDVDSEFLTALADFVIITKKSFVISAIPDSQWKWREVWGEDARKRLGGSGRLHKC